MNGNPLSSKTIKTQEKLYQKQLKLYKEYKSESVENLELQKDFLELELFKLNLKV